jgi:membrane-bound lytic murein transglycosylase A
LQYSGLVQDNLRGLFSVAQGVFTMKPSSSTSVLALAAVLAVVLSVGCQLQQQQQQQQQQQPEPKKTDTSAAPSRPRPRTSPPPEVSIAGQTPNFATEIAAYTLSDFDSLSGWQRDKFSQSWPAFLLSCQVLGRGHNTPWRRICQSARQVDGNNNAAVRAFFEREFSVYQVFDDNQRSDGVITGYFQTEVAGSNKYRPPYIYPVYGPPSDMLYLDTRKLPPGNGMVPVRVQGREVRVQSTMPFDDKDIYALDLSQISRNTLDRKIRLRIDGRRLVPYYTRQEIETRGAPSARVLAFVRSAAELYEMQIQGSGRIRLPDGTAIRLEYAEQNGQPFRPMLASDAKVRTRGAAIELEADDGDASDRSADRSLTTLRVRGFKLAVPAKSRGVAVPGRSSTGAAGSGITDPSYVFFKKVSSKTNGPSGTLGTPLQPGHSLAVDPRSIPLGYPVFISTRLTRYGSSMQRLLMAQDTSSAVRGALRADYFFGSGQEAARQARLMKQQRGQMWVLLPRGLTVAGQPTRTRGAAAGSGLPQCLMPDDDICADE